MSEGTNAATLGSSDERSLRAGLVGQGITLSRTPAMHEAEGKAKGIDYSYQLFDLDSPEFSRFDLPKILDHAEREGFAGLNITYPFKIEVLNHLHSLSENAEMTGAVNTIVFKGGQRRGHNTDLWGYEQNFRRSMKGAPLNDVLLVGAGGAGVAVSHALLALGVKKLWIFDSDLNRVQALASRLASRFGSNRSKGLDTLEKIETHFDGIVNATPVGMAKLPGMPIPEQLVRPDTWISDIIYFPLETELLALAAKRGCRILTGSGMAVFQAVRAFKLFTGLEPDPSRMTKTFESFGTA